ncbi:MAG: hypothetical protein HY985_03355 [Magnetospirillum sp.]|nr:hypothetical protein [Magnetospirillum sp.]
MRTFIAALLVAGAGAGLPTGVHAEAGSIVCERELADVRSLFQDNRGRLSPAESGRIEQSLDLAPTYCRSAPYSSAVTLSVLP